MYKGTVCIAIVIISIIVLLWIHFDRQENYRALNYGRPLDTLYLSGYKPYPRWISTDHNYGYLCDMTGQCKLSQGFWGPGLLSKSECEKKCTVQKTNWIPPWTDI